MKAKNKKQKWSRRDLILFLERMELYISGGLTVDGALKTAAKGVSRRQALSMADMQAAVESGNSLSRSFNSALILPASVNGLIENGESSGRLGPALASARDLLERQDELTKKCISAMVYPAVIGIFALGLTIGLVRGIMPQIIPMLKSLHVALPPITRIVMFISENLLSLSAAYGFIAGIILGMLFIVFYKKFLGFKYVCQSFLLSVPIIGRMIRFFNISILLRTLGSMVQTGMSMPAAYKSAVSALSSEPLRSIFNGHLPEISQGRSVSAVLASEQIVPAHVSSLVGAGEASATLGASLVRAADIIDRDIEHGLKRLTALIEPVMMAGMGAVVGGIALSIMMPIYDVSKVLQH